MKTLRIISGGVAAGCLLLAPMTAATAATQAPTVEQLATRGAAGRLTTADRAFLDRNPAVAALVPDASKSTAGSRAMTAADHALVSSGLGTSLAASTCAGTDRYQIHKSYTGGTIFQYHSYVRWCWTSRSTTVSQHYPYLAKASSIVANRGTTTKALRSLSATSKQADHQNHVELCVVKYGCYANLYPHNKVTVKNAPGSTLWYSI